MVVTALANLRLAAHAIEADGAVVAVGDEAVVHGRVLAAPLCGVGTHTLGVETVIEAFADDAPLDGGVVGVVGGQTLLHRPGQRAVIDDDVLGVLHVEGGDARCRHFAGTEADVAQDDIVVTQVDVVACYADAAAGGGLSEDGDVVVQELQLGGEANGAADLEEDGARLAAVVVADGPAQGAFHEVSVGAVVETGDVAHLATATAGSVFAVAVSTRECELRAGEWRLGGADVQHGHEQQEDGEHLLLQQCLGVLDGGGGDVAAAEHLGNFGDALVGGELLHVARGALRRLFLRHAVVMAAEGGNLGQVGNGDDLSLVAAHLLHDLCHLLGNLAADARVYLVEDDGGKLHGSADHRLQRQHDARYLAARCHLCHGLEWGGGVGGEEEADGVLTALAECRRGDAHIEAHVGHA